MSDYVEPTDDQTKAGAQMDADLWQGTGGGDPNGGYRGNMRNLDARISAISGGGGAAGVDTLETRAPARHNGSRVIDPPNSVLKAFDVEGKVLIGELLETYVSGTVMRISWNNIFAEDADKDMDSTTNWVLRFAAATLGTSGTAKIGANPLSFNKASGNLAAAIDLDRGSADFSAVGHSQVVYFWITLPSVTNLSTVDLYMKVDASNYQKFSVTSDETGQDIVSGGAATYLVKFDISSGGVATGTGWDVTKLARFIGVGVTSSSSTQVYTQIEVDGLRFQEDDITNYIQKGSQVSIYDGTNLENMVIANSGAGVDGTIALASGLSNGYTAGDGNNFIKRNVLDIFGDNQARMENGLSGAAADSQAFRMKTTLPVSLSSANYVASIATISNAHWVVTEVTDSTTFKMEDSGSLGVTDVVSGDVLHTFEVAPNDGNDTSYVNRNVDLAVTAATTNSAGISTVTVTSTAGLVVGDIVHKEEIKNVQFSAVAKGVDESFSAMVLGNSERVLINRGLPYINASNLFSHYFVGGNTAGEGSRNRVRTLPDLTINGTIATKEQFFNAQFGATGFSGTNFYSIPSANSGAIAGVTRLSGWGWVFLAAGGAGGSGICGRVSAGNGWYIVADHTGKTIDFRKGFSDTRADGAYVDDEWNFYAWTISAGVLSFWVNGIIATDSTSAIIDPSVDFVLGGRTGGSEPLIALDKHAEHVMWEGGPALTQPQVDDAYNDGRHRILGQSPGLILRPTIAAQTGQVISLRGDVTRETDAAIPSLAWAGVING